MVAETLINICIQACTVTEASQEYITLGIHVHRRQKVNTGRITQVMHVLNLYGIFYYFGRGGGVGGTFLSGNDDYLTMKW